MVMTKTKKYILNWMPGLALFLNYQKTWLKADLRAGVSVAAVALPAAIAYAQFMGISAISGLYSTMLPLIAYALFGSSRQLIVGPDTATCAVIAAAIGPLAMGNPIYQWQLAIIMTLMIGIWCILAGRLRLGAIADLLSRPILLGLLNGVSVTIIVDQLSKFFGFTTTSTQFIERVITLPGNILHSHIPTLVASTITLIFFLLFRRLKPHWPTAFIIMAIVTVVSWLVNFQLAGIAVIGVISADSLPVETWADFQPGNLRDLVIPTLNTAIISFVSLMMTARSFASKNNYDINVNTEFRALGMANIAAGLSQGFVVSGTSSRTAINDSSGGKTQLVSIIAAIVIAIVVFFFLSPLQYIPIFSLGIILLYSAWSLIDIRMFFQFYIRNRPAFYLSIFTFFSVLIIGIIPGVALAVIMALVQFLRTVFRPTEQLLGMDMEGRIHRLTKDSSVAPIPNVLIYRFNSPLTYFNIGYFKRRILSLVDSTLPTPKWVIIDAVSCFTYPDVNVLIGTEELKKELVNRHIDLVLAGRKTELVHWFSDMRMSFADDINIVSDLYWAVKMVESKNALTKTPIEAQL